MKFTNVKRKQEIEVEDTLVSYTQEDIQQLIIMDLLNKGYEVDKLSFKTDYKYKTDEWGMNQRVVPYFQGVDAIVKKRKFS